MRAVEVWPGVDVEDLAVSPVEPDPVVHPGVVGAVALEPAVDDVGDEPEPRRPVGGEVGGGAAPLFWQPKEEEGSVGRDGFVIFQTSRG